MIFSRKKKIDSHVLKVCGEPLERVRVFRFLGVWLEEKLTYRTCGKNEK